MIASGESRVAHGGTRFEQPVVFRFDTAFNDGDKNRPQLVRVGSIRVLGVVLKNVQPRFFIRGILEKSSHLKKKENTSFQASAQIVFEQDTKGNAKLNALIRFDLPAPLAP
jgi:hypothetical protein